MNFSTSLTSSNFIYITLNAFKIVPRYFGKVWRRSNLCIIQFYWLIALYLFTPFPRNASFTIVKHSCVREELSDVNKSLCKNICFVSSCLCISPLVRAPPQLTPTPSPTTASNPRHVRRREFPTLDIWQYSVTQQVHRKA